MRNWVHGEVKVVAVADKPIFCLTEVVANCRIVWTCFRKIHLVNIPIELLCLMDWVGLGWVGLAWIGLDWIWLID